jgi:tetratricopeptide (TPR) repeat protein
MSAQSGMNDSLLKIIRAGKEDTTTVKALNKLADLKKANDPDTSILLAKRALAIAEKNQWLRGAGKSHHLLGVFYQYKSDYESSLNHNLKAIETWQKLSELPEYKNSGVPLKLKSQTLGNLGITYWYMGDYKKALTAYYEGLEIAEKTGNKIGVSSAYVNIGLVYHDQRDNVNALKYFEKALKLSEELNDIEGLAFNYSNLGLIYLEEKKHDQAIEFFLQSLKHAKSIDNTSSIISVILNLGSAYSAKGENIKALGYLEKGLVLAKEMNSDYQLSLSYGNLGVVYYTMKQADKAERNLLKAVELSEKIGSPAALKEWKYYLSEVYSEKGDYMKAFKYYTEHVNIKDSLVNTENTRKLVQSQMQYDFDKKQSLAKAEQEKIDLQNETERRKQELLIIFISCGLVIILVIAGIILRSLWINRRKNRIITEQKQLVDFQKHQVEEKQKEVIDSIRYAKRIQVALLPTEKLIERRLQKLKNN